MTEHEAAADDAAENESPAGEGADSGRDADSARQAGGDRDAASGRNNESGRDAPDELEAAKAEATENWNRYLRSVAELENLRKRSTRELENARKFGAERLVSALLPVRDSLEAALKVASEADPATVDVETLLEGERATLRLLDQALEESGIAEIDPEGEPFDPERHEAMSLLPSPTAEPNSVLTVVQKGYSLHGRIVRPARVIVAQAPTGTERN